MTKLRLNANILKYPDRVTISFFEAGIEDCDVLVSVTLDNRIAAGKDDTEIRLQAEHALKDFACRLP